MAEKVHEIRHGAVKLTFFEHDGPNGPYMKIAVEHLYKDDEDQWKSSRSLTASEHEMENLELVAAEAKEWLRERVVEGEGGSEASQTSVQ